MSSYLEQKIGGWAHLKGFSYVKCWHTFQNVKTCSVKDVNFYPLKYQDLLFVVESKRNMIALKNYGI